ncbi:MAG: hypothetical protein JO175_05370 [Candidatus Eremiobacteraeota bacterium]|nr:hypothetical protein [Candidatus Eremiobacteraeota bacterium]
MEISHRRWLRCVALVLTAGFSSCTGTGSSVQPGPPALPNAPAQTASSHVLPASLSAINTTPGGVDGAPGQFQPRRGDAKAGGHGSTVDKKVPCLPTMSNLYHVHAFVGIIVNGTYVALPRAIGMVNPARAYNGYVNSATCFYEIHTHDSTGIVHLEAAVNQPLSTAVFSLKNVLDVWGQKYGKTQFGRWTGPIHVFVGYAPLGHTTVSTYAPYPGEKYWYLPLYSHEVVWIEIGSAYYDASQLPPVTFYMEY